MKKQLMTALGLISLISLVLLSFSCGSQPNNNTGNTTAQNNSGANNTPETLVPPADPCVATDLTAKKQAVETDIKDKINNDKSLEDQFDGKLFGYSVSIVGNHLELTLSGVVRGEGKPEKFFKAIEKVIKKSCVERVHFDSSPAATDSTRFALVGICEAPLTECNGECVRTCNPVASPTPIGNNNSTANNSNTNTNSNRNTNSNANTNSNTNANRPK